MEGPDQLQPGRTEWSERWSEVGDATVSTSNIRRLLLPYDLHGCEGRHKPLLTANQGQC